MTLLIPFQNMYINNGTDGHMSCGGVVIPFQNMYINNRLLLTH